MSAVRRLKAIHQVLVTMQRALSNKIKKKRKIKLSIQRNNSKCRKIQAMLRKSHLVKNSKTLVFTELFEITLAGFWQKTKKTKRKRIVK